MRIRTIKPDFWTNEKMAKRSDSTRLLAIALLNWADDEGYFIASPKTIRGALFPFLDTSKTLPGLIHELWEDDFIRLGISVDGREYGWIVHFLIHQRVDKPKKSAISQLCEFRGCVQDASTTHPGLIQDTSTREGKGREGKGREGKSEPSAPGGDETAIPSGLNTPAFHNAWVLFQKHLKEKRKKLTPTQADLQLKEFEMWGPDRAVSAITRSIAKGWLSVHEDKASVPAHEETADEAAERIFAEQNGRAQ